MERRRGGRTLEGELEELREELENYYGSENELKAGLNIELPEKPEALVLWLQIKTLGLPLVAGGLLDQPHLWLRELAVVIDVEQLFLKLEKAQNG